MKFQMAHNTNYVKYRWLLASAELYATKNHAQLSSGLYICFKMKNISLVWRDYFNS